MCFLFSAYEKQHTVFEKESMNDTPRTISVIVPVYNTDVYLHRCINSILTQSYKNFELILVDDGSTDNSPAICDEYAVNNAAIKVIHKQNGGLSDARSAGFDMAVGKYVLFVDSDDYLHTEMLHQLVCSIEREQADMAMCAYYEKRSHREKSVLLPFESETVTGRENIIEKYIKPLIGDDGKAPHMPGFLWLRLMRRELIEQGYFLSERKYFMEDHVFDLLYIDRVQKISVVNKPLYYYCVNADSLTNQYRSNKWEMYSDLYAFYTEYIKKRQIENCRIRLQHFLAAALFSCVDNAVLSGSFDGFLSELNKIRTSTLAKKPMGSIRDGAVPITHRITYLLYRIRFDYLLYKFRKCRMETDHK